MRSLLALLGALLVVAAPVLGGDADKDKKALEGTWEGSEGKTTFVLIVAGNKWTLRDKDKDDFAKGTFTLDVKASPKAMDMKIVEGGGKEAEKYVGKTSFAIYEVSGDTLKWCANEPGKEGRPREFSDKADGLFVVFKRIK